MPVTFDGKLVVAISSRALFDLEASNRVFEEAGVEAYWKYQLDHEDEVLAPGIAFPLVRKLLGLNVRAPARPRVEVILLSRNTADTGLRIMNSIRHYELDISRAAFTGGESTFPYVPAFDAHLFLSANGEDVRRALDAGHAAAQILPTNVGQNVAQTEELRIAFDGDAVLFSDEAERVFKREGLDAFSAAEAAAAREPLSGGPFRSFLAALHRIQAEYLPEHGPIRTAIVTARGAPAHERVVRTLRAWDIRIDEALFLGGLEKGRFLKAFGADIFFDDQRGHVDSAQRHDVAAGHVPFGVANEPVDQA
jgi:5'-nucleotidase